MRNLSTRRVPVRIRSAETPTGVEVTPLRVQMLLRPGRRATSASGSSSRTSSPGRSAAGEVEIVVRGSPVVRVPYVVSRPSPDVDLLSQVVAADDGRADHGRTPAVVSFVAGRDRGRADPAIRPVGELEVQLWRGGELRGVLSDAAGAAPGPVHVRPHRPRPARRAPPRGATTWSGSSRVPEDGTRRQVESVDYARAVGRAGRARAGCILAPSR